LSAISIKQLLEAGVHFGHQTSRWNPKMKEFIFGERNGIHIVDLQRTLRLFKEAVDFLYDLGVEGKEVLFVGTKRQAQEAIEEDAKRCGMHFVTNRWLGGLLTNFQTIQNSIKRYKQLETMKADGSYKNFSKKEVAKLERERKKLDKNLRGIREMNKLPDSVFIIDTDREAIAVKEASRLGIPIIAVVDTNCNPDLIDYVIPGNDDALRSVKLFTSTVSDAIQAGRSVWDTRKEEERQAKEEAEKAEAVARVAREAARAARKAEAEKAAAERAAVEKIAAEKAEKAGPEKAEVEKVEAPAVAEEKVAEMAPVAVEAVKPKAEKATKKAKTKEVAEEPAKTEKDAAVPEDAAVEAEPLEAKPKVEASEEQLEPKAEGAEESKEAARPAKKAKEKKPARKRIVKVEQAVEESATPAKVAEEAADSAKAVKTEEKSEIESTAPPKKKVAKRAAPRKSTTKKASTTKSKATAAKKSPAKKEASKNAEKTVDEKGSATADDAPK